MGWLRIRPRVLVERVGLKMLLMRRDNIDRIFDILKNKRFDSPWSPGDYDAGMNFLGVQGELKVHELHYRTATLYFEWLGEVSAPRRKEDYKDLKPNVLYDFDGSGKHFANPDPRYLLPVGSRGLILKHIQIDDEATLLRLWCARNIPMPRQLSKIPILRQRYLSKAWHEIYLINQKLRKEKLEIDVTYKPVN